MKTRTSTPVIILSIVILVCFSAAVPARGNWWERGKELLKGAMDSETGAILL